MAISIRFFGRALSGPAPGSLPPTGQELRAKVEPRLAELVGAVVASLRTAGIVPVPVTDPHGRQWAPAYILGTLANSALTLARRTQRQSLTAPAVWSATIRSRSSTPDTGRFR
jgi:hypothetical protein